MTHEEIDRAIVRMIDAAEMDGASDTETKRALEGFAVAVRAMHNQPQGTDAMRKAGERLRQIAYDLMKSSAGPLTYKECQEAIKQWEDACK